MKLGKLKNVQLSKQSHEIGFVQRVQLLNPKGTAFLKSDIGLQSIEETKNFYPKKSKYFIRNLLFQKLLPKIDIISIESKKGYTIMSNQIYPQYKNKFLYMPNGINIDKMHSLVKSKSFEEKENLIITVGRIGAAEKNNELLLEVCARLDLKDWKVVFIGPIEESFHSKIENFYNINSHLKDKVIFIGAIYDRVKLYEWYAKSKIFCLTSHAESFGFVLIEAMAYGNVVVTTPVSSANEITENQKAGKIIFSKTELENVLKSYMKNQTLFSMQRQYAQKRVLNNYDWKKILIKLDNIIRKDKE